MTSARSVGRIIGVLVLLHLAAGLIVPYVLLQPHHGAARRVSRDGGGDAVPGPTQRARLAGGRRRFPSASPSPCGRSLDGSATLWGLWL